MFERFIIFSHKENAFYHVPSIVTAPDGSILAFCEQRWQSPCDNVGECHIVMKKSKDNGQTWQDLTELRRKQGAKWHMGSAVTDNETGKVLLMCGGGWLQSADSGDTWMDWQPAHNIQAPGGLGGTHGSGPGIQLQFGRHKGRLIWPARVIISTNGYNDQSIRDRREKCFSTAIFSDDHGKTLYRSNAFHQGTGEACLVERSNGDIYFNARAYFDDFKRKTAISCDCGNRFTETKDDAILKELSQGCNASLIRYPKDLLKKIGLSDRVGDDVILFANPDSDGPYREHGVARLSTDGGKTWQYSKAVTDFGEWFDYSSMTVATDGTILLMYKTTLTMTGLPTSSDQCCSMALTRFDLNWLLKEEIKK
ncbi:sialidase family protein [uncultured Desulfobacter sp.]|uniref:sialidase family protein n=1 Tax=uncultured Desulfobacter sp. TaxID=240139 RepID=UPI002AAACA76|nr:sialidase family protein [uncultured Desulfobacter sp.]